MNNILLLRITYESWMRYFGLFYDLEKLEFSEILFMIEYNFSNK